MIILYAHDCLFLLPYCRKAKCCALHQGKHRRPLLLISSYSAYPFDASGH